MKKVLVFCLFTCSLQVIAGVDRNFVGEGTWSDSAGNSGVVTSHLHLGWLSGIKLDYRVKLNGDEVLHSQMIVQPHSDDSCNLLTLEKKRLGSCRADEEIGGLILSYTQDGDKIELTFVMNSSDDSIDITVKKVSRRTILRRLFPSGSNSVTWQDKLSEVSE